MEKRSPRRPHPGGLQGPAPPPSGPCSGAQLGERDGAGAERVIVVGGGIAGVSCAQECARIAPHREVLLLSATESLKDVQSVHQITETIQDLTVYERTLDAFRLDNPNIRVRREVVVEIDPDERTAYTESGEALRYSRLCLCLGARPKLIADHPNVLGLRDLQSAEELSVRLRSATHVVVVGNGGIALELVHLLKSCDVSWIVKDDFIGNTFFDASSTAFILPTFESEGRTVRVIRPAGDATAVSHPPVCEVTGECSIGEISGRDRVAGGGLGPEWLSRARERAVPLDGLGLAGGGQGTPRHTLSVYFSDCVARLDCAGGAAMPLRVHTVQGQDIPCDFVVSATGVSPVSDVRITARSAERLRQEGGSGRALRLDEEGAICVNDWMGTSLAWGGVFAAGDCVRVQWSKPSEHWMQMRLWSQARSMGVFAARCMSLTDTPERLSAEEAAEFEFASAFAFELFTHVTRFFGYKVVLIGNFNGQGLGAEIEKVTTRVVVTADSCTYTDPSCSSDAKPFTFSCTDSIDAGAGSSVAAAAVELLVRVTPGEEYVKLVVHRGRVVGALLIGDTDLEEVVENLILNNIDVTRFGIDLLDPDRDIEGYFD